MDITTKQVVCKQIDFILINNRFKNNTKNAEMYPSADVGSDYVPAVANINIQLKITRKKTNHRKLDVQQLKDESKKVSRKNLNGDIFKINLEHTDSKHTHIENT